MSTSSKSVRVQLREGNKRRLEEIAKEFSCLYGGDPSITELLEAIALGELQVNAPSIQKEDEDKNSITIKLDIVAPFYLAGVVYLITDVISKSKGNIIAINTQDDGKIEGVLQLLVQVKNSQHLLSILKSLDRVLLDPLTLKEFKYNNENRIREAIEAYDGRECLKKYNQENECKQKPVDRDIIELEPIRKLIIRSRCTVPIRVITLNKPGVVCEITKKIADNSIFISHMQQKIDSKDIAFIDLYLFFHPTSSKEAENSLENIKNIKEEIVKINNVIEVKNLDIKEFSI